MAVGPAEQLTISSTDPGIETRNDAKGFSDNGTDSVGDLIGTLPVTPIATPDPLPESNN
jgi:hypothetical protein